MQRICCTGSWWVVVTRFQNKNKDLDSGKGENALLIKCNICYFSFIGPWQTFIYKLLNILHVVRAFKKGNPNIKSQVANAWLPATTPLLLCMIASKLHTSTPDERVDIAVICFAAQISNGSNKEIKQNPLWCECENNSLQLSLFCSDVDKIYIESFVQQRTVLGY